MPIHTGQDKNGKFYQWGKTGKKYYFKPEDKQSKQRALNKAKKQQTAIYSSGWKGDTMKLIKVRKGDVEITPQDEATKKQILAEYKKLTEKLRKTRQEVEKDYHDKIGGLVSKLSFKPQDDRDIREAEFFFRQQYDLKGTGGWR